MNKARNGTTPRTLRIGHIYFNVDYLWLATVALAAQLAVSLQGFYVGEGDLQFLHQIATRLALGTFRAPSLYVATFPSTLTYPFIVSLLMRLFGTTSPWIFVGINHVVMTAVVCAAYGFLKARMTRAFALAGALLIALHPFTVLYSNTSNAELFFGAGVLLSFFAFAKWEGLAETAYEAPQSTALEATPPARNTSTLTAHISPKLPLSGIKTTLYRIVLWACLCAVPLALAGWARPLAVLMLAAFWGYLLFFSRHKWMHRGIIAGILLVAFVASGMISDRLVRHHTGHAPASSLYSFGWNLYVGASSAGTWNDEDAARFNEVMQTAATPDEVHHYFATAAINRYREMGTGIFPHMTRKLRVWNAHRYVSAFYEGRFTAAVGVVVAVFDLTIFALAVLGGAVILVHRRRSIYFALMFYLAGTVAALALLEIAPRYVVSYRMIFCLFAVEALYRLYTRKSLSKTAPS
ncbi:MAG: hypothetical protein FWC71_01865 [Defluviitaleaceae bacterium]|nr:hypothetical protein [Defluviitaleaceae bacterium]